MVSVNRSRPDASIQSQQQLARLIADRQQEVATGRALHRASDNPAAWARISDISRTQSDIAAWLRNIDRAQSVSRQAEAGIGEISDQLVRANELLVQAGSGSVSATDRNTIAMEIEAVAASVAELIAQKDAFGKPLFADDDPLQIPVDEDVSVSVAPGKATFSALGPMFSNLATAIRSNDPTARANASDELNDAIHLVSDTLGEQGILSGKLERAHSGLQERQIDLSEYRSALEDADLSGSISTLQKLLVNLEAAQASYARIEQSSLFDYLR